MTNYYTDEAIRDKLDDKFGRAQFAQNISNVILSQPQDSKYVIGLYSPWGYGKTSVLSMLEKELFKGGALVVTFNPWIYSTLESMTTGLLQDVANKIIDSELEVEELNNGSSRTKVERWFKRRKELIRYAGLKNSIASGVKSMSEATSFTNNGVTFGKFASYIGGKFAAKSFDTLKTNVENKILEIDKRVIVFVDDVDRLDNDEMFQVFKLIKAIADFKGITYVVALDDVAVSKALNSRFSGEENNKAGRDFLEKIIQIPLHLPYIPQEQIKDLFFEGINTLINDYSLEVSDEDNSRFGEIFDLNLLPHLKTPRMIKRYLNLLTFTLPSVKDEMNVTDAIVLSGFKLLFPSAYMKMQSKKLLLTGGGQELFMDEGEKAEAIKHETEEIVKDEHPDAEAILRKLFPVVRNAYKNSNTWSDSTEKLRDAHRVASADYFDRYFVFGVSKLDVSDENILRIMKLNDSKKISKELKRVSGDRFVQKQILIKLEQYSNSIVNPSEFLLGLVSASNRLLEAGTEGFFSFSGYETFSRTLFRIYKRQSKARLSDALNMINSTDDSELLTYIIRDINLDYQEEKDASALNDKEFDEFKNAALQRIKTLAVTQAFYKKPRKVSYILYQYWLEFGGKRSLKSHLDGRLKNSDEAIEFLTNYLPTWTGSNGRGRGDLNAATFEVISRMINIKKIYDYIIADYPSAKDVTNFESLEHRSDNSKVNRVGNEDTREFKTLVAKQFSYLYFKQTKTDS